MIRLFNGLLTSALLILFAINGFSQPKNLFDKESSLAFANYLFRSANYEMAAIEFERLALIDSSNLTDHQFKVVLSYRLANKLDIGFKRFNEWFPDESSMAYPINREFAIYLIGLGYFKDANDFLKETQGIDNDEKLMLLGISNCFLMDWAAAETNLNGIKNETHATKRLKEVVADGKKLKFKRPGLAAVLSIVPGLGRVYTGNYADAGLSALTIATLAWQAYTGFDKNGSQSFYGWLMATFTTAFYAGNIYGSYRAAQLHNKQKTDALYNKTYSIYRLLD